MFGNNTDTHWEKLAELDPYYSVLTCERFHRDCMDAAARKEFFESGERHVQEVVDHIISLGWRLQRETALDFGCGVGRLVLPLARRFQEVIGVDCSPTMLTEASLNCKASGLTNVQLVRASDLSAALGPFDLIHCRLVLQHIPVRRGLKICQQLIAKLKPGGIAALQFPFAIRDQWPRRTLNRARTRIPPLNILLNLLRGRPLLAPPMQMNSYPVNQIFRLLIESGIREAIADMNDNNPRDLQVLLYFRRDPCRDESSGLQSDETHPAC